MPGTIQVSVMDFQGPPSTSTASAFLKVSMGKREYQTSDKGDFSFPLTNFRDNLVLKLLDAEGTELANKGIQTMSIVQKVSWDETFFFDGGGYVQLKLQFILNEEERTRIRLKREEAVKKKLENIPKVGENPVIARPTGGFITSSVQADIKESDLGTGTVLTVGSRDTVNTQARILPNADISPADSRSNYGGEGSILKQKIPKPVDERERVFPAPVIERTEGDRLKASQNVKKLETESLVPNVQPDQVKGDSSRLKSEVILGKDDDRVDKSPPKVAMKRSPSSVWNLVTAFETGLAKDSRSPVIAPAVRSENKKVGKQDRPKDNVPVDFSDSAKQSSGKHKDPFLTSTNTEESSNSAKSSVGDRGNEIEKAAEKLRREPIRPVENKLDSEAREEPEQLERSSSTEKPTITGRMHTELSEESPESAESGVGDTQNEMVKAAEKLIKEPIRPVENESDSPTQLERSSSTEKPTTSGRMHTELSKDSYSSGGTVFAEEMRRIDSTKTDVQVASVEKLKSLECYEEELLLSEYNRKHLCVTAAGNRVMSPLGSGPPEIRSHQNKTSLSSGERGQEIANHASENEAQKDQERSRSIENPSSKGSPDNGSGGLFGQMIKIAVIVGFGVLVIITRQRDPRKSKREGDQLLLTASEFMDVGSNLEE